MSAAPLDEPLMSGLSLGDSFCLGSGKRGVCLT
jgi:hypothetical protein